MNHHKAIRQSFILIGLASSLLLLSITLFIGITANTPNTASIPLQRPSDTLATKSSQAPSTSPSLENAEDILETIDDVYASESVEIPSSESTSGTQRARLLRLVSLMTGYRDSLTAYIGFYQSISQKLPQSPAKQQSSEFNTCIAEAEAAIIEGNNSLTGIFSQIGLIASLESREVMELDQKLRTQIESVKNFYDTARRQLRTCPDYVKL